MDAAPGKRGLLARLPLSAFWALNVITSLVAGFVTFFLFGGVAASLGASVMVIALSALTGAALGFFGCLFKLRKMRRRRILRGSVDASVTRPATTYLVPPPNDPPKTSNKTLDDKTGDDAGPIRTEFKPNFVFANDRPKERPSVYIPEYDGKAVIVAVVIGVVLFGLFTWPPGSAMPHFAGVDGVLAVIGQTICGTFDAIGARSFAPEACSYDPVAVVHHIIIVIGGIVLLEEILRRLGPGKPH